MSLFLALALPRTGVAQTANVQHTADFHIQEVSNVGHLLAIDQH